MNDPIFSLLGRQTHKDFIAELDEAEKDWEKNDGATLDQIKSKYKL